MNKLFALEEKELEKVSGGMETSKEKEEIEKASEGIVTEEEPKGSITFGGAFCGLNKGIFTFNKQGIKDTFGKMSKGQVAGVVAADAGIGLGGAALLTAGTVAAGFGIRKIVKIIKSR